MKKKFLIILASLLLLLALFIAVIGPVALVFPVYILFGFNFYVVYPLFNHLLVLVSSLLACVLGGLLLSRWPVARLRYAALPAAVMGLTTAWLPPQACGFDPLTTNSFAETIIFVGAAGLVARIKAYNARVCTVLAVLCGIVFALQIHVSLCHDDYTPDAGLIAVSSRSGVWLATLAAMGLGWLSAWFGTRIYRLLPSDRV